MERQAGKDLSAAEAEGPELPENLEKAIEAARSLLRRPLEKHPYMVLAAAVACGHVLAAGLPRPVVTYLARRGLRSGMWWMASTVLDSMLDAAALVRSAGNGAGAGH